jgi:hypothetical protein
MLFDKLTKCHSIWLANIQDRLPRRTQLDGLDISFDAVPPVKLFSSNVTFRHWNVNKSIPEDLVGAFDIVHLRFFAFVLRDDEVAGVVAKLFDLLSMFHKIHITIFFSF